MLFLKVYGSCSSTLFFLGHLASAGGVPFFPSTCTTKTKVIQRGVSVGPSLLGQLTCKHPDRIAPAPDETTISRFWRGNSDANKRWDPVHDLAPVSQPRRHI